MYLVWNECENPVLSKQIQTFNNFLIDVKKGLLFYIPEGSIKRWTETGKSEEFSTCCWFHSSTFTALILYIMIYIDYKIHALPLEMYKKNTVKGFCVVLLSYRHTGIYFIGAYQVNIRLLEPRIFFLSNCQIQYHTFINRFHSFIILSF